MRATIKSLAAFALAFSTPLSFAQSSTPAPHWDWPGPWHMWSGWGFWWVFPILMMVFMIVLCAFFLSRMFGGHGRSRSGDTTSSALVLLNERFAKGEISKEEFEEKRAILGRSGSVMR